MGKKFHVDVVYIYKKYLEYRQILGANQVALIIKIRKPKSLMSLNRVLRPLAEHIKVTTGVKPMCGAIHIKKASNTFRLTISYGNLAQVLGLFKATREYIRVRKHGMLDLVEAEITCGHSLPSFINLLRGFGILEFDIVQIQPSELNLSMPRMA